MRYRTNPFRSGSVNVFDAEVSDIHYFQKFRLPGERAAGVEDILRHPALPRSACIGTSSPRLVDGDR
jgi:hypothetical protein